MYVQYVHDDYKTCNQIFYGGFDKSDDADFVAKQKIILEV